MLKTKYGKTMLSSKCAVCRSKKSRFVKHEEVEAKRLLSSLGLKTPLILICVGKGEGNFTSSSASFPLITQKR